MRATRDGILFRPSSQSPSEDLVFFLEVAAGVHRLLPLLLLHDWPLNWKSIKKSMADLRLQQLPLVKAHLSSLLLPSFNLRWDHRFLKCFCDRRDLCVLMLGESSTATVSLLIWMSLGSCLANASICQWVALIYKRAAIVDIECFEQHAVQMYMNLVRYFQTGIVDIFLFFNWNSSRP